MSATAELKRDLAGLQAEYDALTHAIDAKHDELDEVIAKVRREEARLEKIKAEITRIKSHYGVSPL